MNKVQYNLKPGQETNEETYMYFLEILPPAFWQSGVFQVGEPFDHNNQGLPRYYTYRHKNNKYFYEGILTRGEARRIAEINLARK